MCLEIKNNTSVLNILCIFVKALNNNDYNKENYYSASTDFIRKLTDFFFITIGEKAWKTLP